MRPTLPGARTLVSGLLALGLASSVFGLSSRVFVSPLGKDSASCGAFASPCKTLAGAHTQAAPGGTVVVLYSGEFGPVTITKALTIEAPTGLTAQDGTLTAVRGSVASGNTHGISAQAAAGTTDLTITDCVVSNNAGNGISADGGSAGSATVRVSGSTVTGNQTGLVQYYPSGPTSTLLSRGDNTVEANTVPTFGTIGSYSAK